MADMKVAIIDAEIVGATKHRFPNLCSMKLSSYHKSMGDVVVLKTDYENLSSYDKVYISKVFTKTIVPDEALLLDNVEYGGTGFFYDKAPALPYDIEHTTPDYHLYDEWVQERIEQGYKPSEFRYYTDYSIGYLTRKCFRQCSFCVNRNYKGVEAASPLEEFMDESRPKLCFLDDNFFGFSNWGGLIERVASTGKRFQFKQGLDERLLTERKILSMAKWKYDGELIFAFDNIEDKDLVIEKLELVRRCAPEMKREMRFYVFCGFDRSGKYDEEFWENDLRNLFERIKILSEYKALAYVMRYEKVYEHKLAPLYACVASWCNQPGMFRHKTFREFAILRGQRKTMPKGACWLAMENAESRYPEIAKEYFDFTGSPYQPVQKG